MTRWESNMVRVALSYLDNQSPRAARMVLEAVLRSGIPQDAPEAVPARPTRPESLKPQELSEARSAGSSGDSWAEPTP